MFLKEKFTADGLFEKLKVRLVAGDHFQIGKYMMKKYMLQLALAAYFQ